jgi:UDP-N-acetylglucosamine 3-dehydrogenase
LDLSGSVVQVGILSFAHGHASSYAAALRNRSDVHLAGVWDNDQMRGISSAEHCSTLYYEDIDKLLKQNLDAVIVTSENSTHRQLVELAVSAGVKTILCEKPLATTMTDAQAMVELCNSNGVFLATAFPCRYSQSFLRLVDSYRNGSLGEILGIRATNHGVCPFGWFVDPEKSGGGAVIDHTVHVADLNRVLLQKEVTEVYAELGNNMYHQEWEDTGFLTITYENRVFCTLDSSWSRPKKSFPTWGDVTLEVVATGGVVQVDMFGQALNYYDEKLDRHRQIGWGSNTDSALVNDFIAVAKGDTAPNIATGYDGLKALEVALAAYESAKTKRLFNLVS